MFNKPARVLVPNTISHIKAIRNASTRSYSHFLLLIPVTQSPN